MKYVKYMYTCVCVIAILAILLLLKGCFYRLRTYKYVSSYIHYYFKRILI